MRSSLVYCTILPNHLPIEYIRTITRRNYTGEDIKHGVMKDKLPFWKEREWVKVYLLNIETSMLPNKQSGLYLSERRLGNYFLENLSSQRKELYRYWHENNNKVAGSPISLFYGAIHHSIIRIQAHRVLSNECLTLESMNYQ